MLKTTLSLQTSTGLFPDIQIWADPAASFPSLGSRLDHVSVVNFQRIPLFLVSGGPYNVYSEQTETETYFYEQIVNQDPKSGVMARSDTEGTDKYVVFFKNRENTPKVQCFVIDFAMLENMSVFAEKAKDFPEQDVFFAAKSLSSSIKSDTSVFDRVLDKKSSKKSSANATPQPQVLPSVFTTSTQISSAVNRVILSELRLRGLSQNKSASAKDKIAVREIYHMTKEAALFALRKHGYEFNRGSGRKNAENRDEGVSLGEIQGIVESLLSIFVDVNPNYVGESAGVQGPF